MAFARPPRLLLLALVTGLAISLSSLPSSAAAQSSQGVPWQQLSNTQQVALQPLAARWSSIPADQQRKWLAMANNYPRMSQQEQARMQQRMANWAALSAQEREQARRNFDAAREGNSAQERKAKWEAYQNLDERERQALTPKKQPAASTARPIQAPNQPTSGSISVKP